MPNDVFQQLKESPDAVLIINQFQDYLKTEAQKRQKGVLTSLIVPGFLLDLATGFD
jgi:hypothetical protein